MEFVIVLVLVGAIVYFFTRWVGSLTKPHSVPVKPTVAAPKNRQPVSSGAAYVKRNLSHLPPQSHATRSYDDASIYLSSDRWDELLVAGADGMSTLFLQMHNDRLWLTEPVTGLLVSVGNRRLRRMGIWTANVRGIDYHRAAARQGNFLPGSTVRLVREPLNEYDKNAVAVCSDDDDRAIGYINKGMAPGLAKLLDSGETLNAISLSGQGKGTFSGVEVLAASASALQHLLRKNPLTASAPDPDV